MTSGATTAPAFRHTIVPGAGNRVRVVITMEPSAHSQGRRRPRPGPGPVTGTARRSDQPTVRSSPRPRPAAAPLSQPADTARAPLSLLTAPSPLAHALTRPQGRQHARELRRRWLVASVLLVLAVGVGVPLLFQALYAFMRH